MIPKITRGGTSFKGAFQYYMHDKCADTRNRVEWAQTENMLTSDPVKAWKIMAYTAKEQDRLKEASGQSRAGRKLEKPVFAFSLAWHPEENPDKDHMLDTARKAIEMLGLSEHEAVIVAHRDEPQKHVHVIVNRVHPVTGLAGDIRNGKLKLSDFARDYERESGRIYCEQREKNHERREQGEPAAYVDPVVNHAWENSICGRDFAEILESKGYFLAQGRKRIVVVDPYGKSHNPVRMLSNVKSKDFRERLADINIAKLPKAESLTAKFKQVDVEARMRREVFDKLAAMQLDALRENHANELDRVVLQYGHRIDTAKRRLVQHYELPQKKQAVEVLREKTLRPPWWKKVLGIAKRDREALHACLKEYKNSCWRYRERIGSIVNERDATLTSLRERQHRERIELEVHIDRQRQSGNYAVMQPPMRPRLVRTERTHESPSRDR